MKPYQPSEKLVVRDSVSLSMDEDLSDDVEDEVFIRDGRTCRTYEDRGAKRPLMTPRSRGGMNSKSTSCGTSSPILKKYRRRRCWNCCEPFCYGLAAITVLIGLIVLAALLLTAFPAPLQKIKVWLHKESPFSGAVIRDRFNSLLYSGTDESNSSLEVVPCTQITVQKVWTRVIARVNSESPLRKLDVNGDGVLDVIVGYGIDEMIDDARGSIPRCTSQKTGLTDMCGGGLMALNGLNGDTMWQRWTSFTIFSLKCAIDINSDGQSDCVAAGRGGLILAVDGKKGNILWELKDYSDLESYAETSIDLYTINVVRDLNNDGIADVLAVHVEETQRAHGGHIKLISGATGIILKSIPTPYREEMFVPIQVLVQKDGSEQFLMVTGGQNSPGGIYTLKQESLMKFTDEKDFVPVTRIDSSGFMVPAVLTDLNGDSVEDLVVSSFNSTVYAFDGANKTQLWAYTIPDSESVSSVVPGHFDHDNVTDFMVKYNTGPGFPIYYYSQTTILNGTNGQPFLDDSVKDSGGPNSLLGGVTVSQTGGGDFFLHWQVQCRNKLKTTEEYQFIPESDIIQQSRADTCMLRYNESSVLKLYAINRHMEPPGAVIFSTDDLQIKLNGTESQQQREEYVAPIKHPKMKLKGKNDGRKASDTQQIQVRMDKKLDQHSAPGSVESNQAADDVGVVMTGPNKSAEMKKQRLREQMLKTNRVPEPLEVQEENKRKEKLNMNNVYKKYTYNANDGEDLWNGGNEKPYIYLPYDQGDPNSQNPFMQNQIPVPPPQLDYDYGAVNDENDRRRYQRPRYRGSENRYSGGRDVRSKFGVFDDVDMHDPSLENQVINETNINSQIVKKVLLNDVILDELKEIESNSKGSKETLWDLEMEKEAKEAINDVSSLNYDYNKEKRESESKAVSVQPSSSTPTPTTTESPPNENILPSIASTGVLLKSLNSSSVSPTIDYVFVMNIRESETYPPLFFEQDLACVQEKLSAYQTFSTDDLLQLEKKFLKQCLKARLPNLTPSYQKFETQIIVTRVEIGCSCDTDLNPSREVCSKLHSYEQQRWTEYMGNTGSGAY
ncbi:uncharacterized protein LOC129731241 [Wyeomyia smithii]|uniref:uncharacterized protein LOC129731241 n=1 Tax=Wyeomyia smithii TaxID=174621 RepID=UPI002467FEB0|nr:uncharacterized protein LOC129731241 [Wyeomyia smithii]XP_055547056.1 uncharacterized protein LOC129731241 [Wyeomyia smithii]XP_055547057.1 uncharacterized protein LOC129731241 [Wyeomyia smithii]